MDTVRIRIGPLDAQQAYPLELFGFPDGRPLASASLPQAELDAQPWPSAAIQNQFNSNAQGSDNFRKIGNRLSEWIVRGDVGTEWRKLRGSAVRTMLDIAAPELITVPWELLGGEAAPLFRNITKPLMRYHAGMPGADATAPWPVRLLIVAGKLDAVTDAAGEIDRIEQDLLPYSHSIDLEVLREPARAEFAAAVESFQPHILHFTGHSSTIAGGNVSVLHFQKQGQEWDWSSIDIAANLALWGWLPRLVFLNACRTANSAASLSVSEAFIQAGVPASIANQGDIQGDLAGQLAATIYNKLWQGEHLDAAMVRGREAIITAKGSDRRDWAFPVLSLSVLPEAVLPQMNICPPERYPYIQGCAVFGEVKMFAGRRSERRQLRTRFEPISPVQEPEYVVVVTGSTCDKLGKSHVMKWSGEGLALGGADVHYVTVADGAKKTFLDILWQILDAKPERSAEAIPRRILHRFNWDVHQILTKGATSAWDGQPFETRTEFDPGKLKSDDAIGRIFESFYEALREASGARRLVLVLDDFRYNNEPAISKELMKQDLWPRLFQRVAAGDFKKVRMALVMRPDDTKLYGMQELIPPSKWITLKPFPKDDYEALARELFWYCDEGFLREMIASVGKRLPDPWLPEALNKLRRVADEYYEGGEHLAKVGRMQ